MTPADVEEMLAFCGTNPQYYEFCGAPLTREILLHDLALLPPGKDAADKYYLGFYQGASLTALLDLVAGYPEPETAFIGFFMMHGACAGQGAGSALITELARALRDAGFAALQLGYEKSNPQASRFWRKNGFAAQREVAHEYGQIIVARRAL